MAHQCIRARWPSGSMYLWQFVKQGKQIEIEMPSSLTLDEPSLMRDAALAGADLAYMWETHVRDDIGSGRLVSVLNSWMPSSPRLSLYYSDRRHVPGALRTFIDMLRAPAPTLKKVRREACIIRMRCRVSLFGVRRPSLAAPDVTMAVTQNASLSIAQRHSTRAGRRHTCVAIFERRFKTIERGRQR